MTFPSVLYRLALFSFLASRLVHAQTIVAEGSLLNQSGYFGTKTIYTSTQGGSFLVYLDFENVEGTVIHNPVCQCQGVYGGYLGWTWTDEIGAHLDGTGSLLPNWTYAAVQKISTSNELPPIKIRLAPGASFSLTETALSTAYGPSLPGPAGDYYNVYWAVKQIGAVGTY